jgi:hypothetical protein
MTSLKFLVSVLFFLSATTVFGQDRAEMADAMRSEGKIYVVVAIIAIVLAGLIKKLEKLVSDRKKQTN